MIQKNRYYHGSGSASLVGVLSDESPGLKSTGTLLQEGRVPFCGELMIGIANVNTRSLSVIPGTNIKYVVNFALDLGMKTWSLEKGVKDLDNDKHNLQRAEDELKKWSKSNSTTREFYTKQVDIYIKRIQIHERRLQQWPTLDERCQELIQHPFPVIYQVDYAGRIIYVYSDYADETGIPVDIELKDMEVYVPKSKIQVVQSFNKNVPVHTFKDLSHLQSYSRDNEWAINQLLQKYC